MSSTDGEQPPGWYPDPRDPSRHRYWDGERWSELAAADAPGSTGPDTREEPPGAASLPPRTVVIALALAALTLLAVAAWILTRDRDGGDEERTGSPTTTTTATGGASGEDPRSGSDTTTTPSDPPPTDPSTTDAPPTSAGGSATPGSEDLAPCQVDDTLLLELLREHPPLASVADELTVERVRCVGEWASAVAAAASTDSALALYRREGDDWTFILLGSTEPCTALGIPVAAEADLGCNEWTSG